MQFGITIPLQKFLNRKAPPYGPEADLFYCWELHVFGVQGKRALVGVNAGNRAAVVLWGMKKADWARFDELFQEGVRRLFQCEGYTTAQIDKYFELAGAREITKTHGRRPVASLNRMTEYLMALPSDLKSDELFQENCVKILNQEWCKAGGYPEQGLPVEYLEEDMRRTGIL